MELALQYTKKRSEFGHHCVFDDVPAQILESIASTNEYDADYVKKNPCITTLDTTPQMAEHDVCTERIVHKSQGMRHAEGGWPENVDATEADQVDRYLKKAAKDNALRQRLVELAHRIEGAVKQNNTMDIYEEYFDTTAAQVAAAGEAPAAGSGGAAASSTSGIRMDLELTSEQPSARGLAVFKDPVSVKRTATMVNWHPDGDRIAVSYSVLKFQDENLMSGRLPTNSYIWDIQYPNHPMMELCSPSPVVSMRYNFKTPDILCAGCYNGQVGIFDTKKPRAVAITSSAIDKSHHDPVYDVFWVQSKTNNQFVSVSTDGQALWWDTRKLTEPTDVIQLTDAAGRILGGSSMEYNIEAGPAKYLVGTEQGIVLSLNMRKRGGGGKDAGNTAGMVTAMDNGPGKHHGPIYSIHRNPFHPTSYLSVGDWTCRIWNEKNKGPIMATPYAPAYLTAGAWSPVRPAVFFTCRSDGLLDCWDYNYRQTHPAYSHKVSEHALSCLSIQGSVQSGGGRMIAVGDVNGTVSLLEVSDNLCTAQPNEKVSIGLLFDRESKREENLEKRAQLLARMARQASAKGGNLNSSDGTNEDNGIPSEGGSSFNTLMPISAEAEEALRKADAEFLEIIRTADEEEAKGGAKKAAEEAAAE